MDYISLKKNISWTVFEKILYMVNSALIFFVIAKFYSKSNFADYAYLSSILSIFLVIGSFGTNEYLVKLTSRSGYLCNNHILNVLSLRCIFTFPLSLFFFYEFGFSDKTIILFSLLFLHLVFEPSLAILEGLFRLYDVCKIKIVCYCFSLIIKVLIISSQFDVFWLNTAIVFELLIISLSGLLLLIKNKSNFKPPRVSEDYVSFGYIFKQSWPIAVTGIMTLVYNRIDQVMLYKLSDVNSMASYSMAVKFSEIWIFLPLAVSNAYFVYLSSQYNKSKTSFYRMVRFNIKRIYLLNCFLAVLFSFISTVVITLFLPNYSESILLMYGLNICSIMITLRHYTGKCYYIEGFNNLIILRAVLGALINVMLNLLLLPKFGSSGAVASTFVSLLFISIFFDVIFNKTYIYFKIKVVQIFCIFKFSEYKKVINENYNGSK